MIKKMTPLFFFLTFHGPRLQVQLKTPYCDSTRRLWEMELHWVLLDTNFVTYL